MVVIGDLTIPIVTSLKALLAPTPAREAAANWPATGKKKKRSAPIIRARPLPPYRFQSLIVPTIGIMEIPRSSNRASPLGEVLIALSTKSCFDSGIASLTALSTSNAGIAPCVAINPIGSLLYSWWSSR